MDARTEWAGEKLIVVGSLNPVKAAAITSAFEKLFPGQHYAVEMVDVRSGVSDQPMSDHETRAGAGNRVARAREAVPHADIWAGLEGGIQDQGHGEMSAFAWIVVQSAIASGTARTATFPLPEVVAKLVRDGTELGHANDIVFGRTNTKQTVGAIGTLTGGLIDRRQLYEHAAIMAMIPLKNSAVYRTGGE